ncbi:hypothetical protein ACVBE9_04765 [Eionea flava]
MFNFFQLTEVAKRRLMRIRTAKAGLLATMMLGLQGCVFSLVDWVTPKEGYELAADQAYGTLPRQRLDIYTPTQSNARGLTLGTSEQVMRNFSLAKNTPFFVEYFANSALFPSIFASNDLFLSHRKFHSDLFRGSFSFFLWRSMGSR